MELGLQGKRAVVMAASRGLGYACALALAREGCRLVIGSRDQERITAAAAAIREETGAEVTGLVADVSTAAGVQRLVEACLAAYDGLDIGVHNAGGPPFGGFETVSEAQWRAAFDLNLMSLVWLVEAAISPMRAAGGGRLITIASSSVRQPIPNLVLSNALRPGVLGLAKTVARELAADQITVNVVIPGRIATERIEELDRDRAVREGRSAAAVRQESVQAIPAGRLGQPQELAHLVTFLASTAAGYITGAAIPVDGGLISAL